MRQDKSSVLRVVQYSEFWEESCASMFGVERSLDSEIRPVAKGDPDWQELGQDSAGTPVLLFTLHSVPVDKSALSSKHSSEVMPPSRPTNGRRSALLVRDP